MRTAQTKPRIKLGLAGAPDKSYDDFRHYIHEKMPKADIIKTTQAYIAKTCADAKFLIDSAKEYEFNKTHVASVLYWQELGREFVPHEYTYNWYDEENVKHSERRFRSYDHEALLTRFVNDVRASAEKVLLDKAGKAGYDEDGNQIRKAIKKERSEEKIITTEVLPEIADAIFDAVFASKEPKLTVKQFAEHRKVSIKKTYMLAKDLLQRQYDEYTEVLTSPDDEDLQYAFKHITVGKLKRLQQILAKMIAECSSAVEEFTLADAIAENGKPIRVRKPRVKKAVKPEVQVKNLKFKTEDIDLSLKSIQAKAIIGATRLYTFNAKTLEFTEYVSSLESGFGVKGTTLLNADLEKSRKARIVKHDAFIADSLRLQAKAFGKTWETLKVKIRNPSPRINEDTILLRVFKEINRK